MPSSKAWAGVAVCGAAAAGVAVWLELERRKKLQDVTDDVPGQVMSGGEARNVPAQAPSTKPQEAPSSSSAVQSGGRLGKSGG